MISRLLIILSLGFWTTNVLANEPLKIVTSFSILQDITQNIVGDKAKVSTIVPANTDAHSYNLTPKNMVEVEKADLLIISGLGFEGFMERYLTTSGYTQKLITASTGIKVLAPDDLDVASHEHTEHEHMPNRGADPHVWQNPLNGLIYVDNIVKALCAKDATNCPYYTQNATKYKNEITQLDTKYSQIFKAISEPSRAMITTHDAFNYMAKRYDIKVYSPLGLDNNSEATAKNYLLIKTLLTSGKVTAIFLENIANNRIIENIESSTGLKQTATPVLYSDALSTDPEANTYLKFLDYNLKTVSSSMH